MCDLFQLLVREIGYHVDGTPGGGGEERVDFATERANARRKLVHVELEILDFRSVARGVLALALGQLRERVLHVERARGVVDQRGRREQVNPRHVALVRLLVEEREVFDEQRRTLATHLRAADAVHFVERFAHECNHRVQRNHHHQRHEDPKHRARDYTLDKFSRPATLAERFDRVRVEIPQEARHEGREQCATERLVARAVLHVLNTRFGQPAIKHSKRDAETENDQQQKRYEGTHIDHSLTENADNMSRAIESSNVVERAS